uniref:alpha-1,4-glucan--maltose-1-phosphate maltosyltransferase n=1 Tax=Nocardioides terrisoli TaxID=3388267 RepID=UPI0037C99675
MDVTPVVEHGRYPAKAVVGEAFDVTALVFREGHDELGADVVLTDPSGVRRPPLRMSEVPDDVSRMRATVRPDTEGAWQFEVHSWSDPLATWLHHTGIKVRAGVDVELMFAEGVLLLRRWLETVNAPDGTTVVKDAIKALRDKKRPVEARLAVAESPELTTLLRAHPLRDLLASTDPYPLFVDRRRALFSAWYEFFPRSEGAVVDADGTVTTGTFATAAQRLPAVAAMGFDIIYLPPIHPIGEVNRKGRNNSLDPGPDDVGSPWAIGSRYGGHDAIHPDLGTIEDFEAFVAAARANGLEVAIDFALQAAPDHPWVTSHPEWFTTRADGSIAYAENPPKKYQDIYPINFDNDPEGIYAEAERVLRHWMAHGVRIFRVDNPHTKPVAFWEWLLGRIRATDPDVLFLSEAFTKPPMMRALATVGFHQSYTYFTWRNNRPEIESYFTEVAHETAHVLRPSFWVNTPDILHAYLQYGGPAAFRIRAVLAATGSPSWGVYAGYELFEHVALRPGSEEYLDSEKYQIRIRDWAGAEAEGRSLAPYLTRLNAIRRAHPALQQLRDLAVHSSDDDSIVVYSKRAVDDGLDDTVIVVVNLDPHGTRETTVHLDLPALGLEWSDTVEVYDELSGHTWHWGAHNYVRLDPYVEPAHVLSVRSPR